MSKKKIAFVTPIYLPANLYGSDTFVKLLAEKFASSGYDTSIITSKALIPRYWYDPFFAPKISQSFTTINKVKVHRLGCNQFFSSACFLLSRYFFPFFSQKKTNQLNIMSSGPSLKGLKSLLKRQRFDVLHVSPFPLFINQQVEDAIAAILEKPQLVLTPFFHAKVADYENKALKPILDQAETIHAVTDPEKKDLVRLHSVNSGKIKVIPLFLNVRHLHQVAELSADIQQFKKKYHLLNKKIILFAGLKGEMKGAVNLLYVINKLYKENKEFVLIAIGHNTKEWEIAKKNINPDCLIDFGYKKGKSKEIIFGACDIFCMPSRSDSFGLVYLEAWHKKKPVIAANIPAIKELIGQNQGGILVKFDDNLALASAIKRLAKDPQTARKFGQNGRNALTKKYTLDAVFPQYENLFTK